MGASSSLFATETFNATTHFTIPVPRTVYDTVTHWEEQLHSRDANARELERAPDLLRKYIDFLNRCDQIGEIVDKGRQDGFSYFSVIFQTCMLLQPQSPPPEFQQVYDLYVDTTTEAGSFDPFENADAWIASMQQPRYDNVLRHYLAFATQFDTAVETQKDAFFVVFTRLFDSTRAIGHATVTLVHLKFVTGARCSVNVVILDPHGCARTERMARHEHAWTQFLHSVEKEQHMTFVAKTFSKPYTHGGLQRKEPICVQWALVLGLTYAMNTPVTRKRKRDDDDACFSPIPDQDLFAVMDVMARRRKRIMTAFMFWIHLVSGSLFPLIDARARDDDDARPTVSAELLAAVKNFPSSMWPPATASSSSLPRQQRLIKLTSDANTCIFDMYDCEKHDNARDCTHPCQWLNSRCFNPHFLPPPPPPPEHLLAVAAAPPLPPSEHVAFNPTLVTPAPLTAATPTSASAAAAAAMAAMIAASTTPMVKKRKTK